MSPLKHKRIIQKFHILNYFNELDCSVLFPDFILFYIRFHFVICYLSPKIMYQFLLVGVDMVGGNSMIYFCCFITLKYTVHFPPLFAARGHVSHMEMCLSGCRNSFTSVCYVHFSQVQHLRKSPAHPPIKRKRKKKVF